MRPTDLNLVWVSLFATNIRCSIIWTNRKQQIIRSLFPRQKALIETIKLVKRNRTATALARKYGENSCKQTLNQTSTQLSWTNSYQVLRERTHKLNVMKIFTPNLCYRYITLCARLASPFFNISKFSFLHNVLQRCFHIHHIHLFQKMFFSVL